MDTMRNQHDQMVRRLQGGAIYLSQLSKIPPPDIGEIILGVLQNSYAGGAIAREFGINPVDERLLIEQIFEWENSIKNNPQKILY